MLSKTIVKKVKFIRTHLENIPTAANCCWLDGSSRWDAKLSLWAEFVHSSGWLVNGKLKENRHMLNKAIVKKVELIRSLLKNIPALPIVVG